MFIVVALENISSRHHTEQRYLFTHLAISMKISVSCYSEPAGSV